MKTVKIVILLLLFFSNLKGKEGHVSEPTMTMYASTVVPLGWETFKLFSDSTFSCLRIQGRIVEELNGVYRIFGDTLTLTQNLFRTKDKRTHKYRISKLNVHSIVENGELKINSNSSFPSELVDSLTIADLSPLIGAWVMNEDSNVNVVIDEQSWSTIYRDKLSGRFNLTWRAEIPELMDNSGAKGYLTLKNKDRTLRYAVIELSKDEMLLMAYPSGEKVELKKIK